MQAQKTAEQQPEQLDQQPSEPAEITQLEEVVATESDEANEQERIRAAKRKALASQTRLPEPTADEEQASEVIEAPASVEPQAQVAKKTFDLELEKAKLIDEARNMRPAAAALNHAKARALEPMTEPPLFGDQVDLATSLPPRSKPKSLGIMRHLGNNQYMLQIPVQKGKQEFVVGDYRFFKMVPKQFHQSLCMILLDFRNKENPGFQLLFID